MLRAAQAGFDAVSGADRQGKVQRLRGRPVNDPAVSLVGVVVGAQRIAVHQQGAFTVQLDDGFIRQQRETGLPAAKCCEIRKSRLPCMKLQATPRSASLRSAALTCRPVGARRIVADPALEQVAEDIQGVGLAGRVGQKAQKAVGDCGSGGVQVQVRDEQYRHLAAGGFSKLALLDDHCFNRDIRHAVLHAGQAVADIVDDLHALNDLAKHRITPAGGFRVERKIVGQVDVELGIARMRFAGSRHGDGAAPVAESVAGFIGDAGMWLP